MSSLGPPSYLSRLPAGCRRVSSDPCCDRDISRSLPPHRSRLNIRRVVVIEARTGASSTRTRLAGLRIGGNFSLRIGGTSPSLGMSPSSLLLGHAVRPTDRFTVIAQLQQIFPGVVVLGLRPPSGDAITLRMGQGAAIVVLPILLLVGTQKGLTTCKPRSGKCHEIRAFDALMPFVGTLEDIVAVVPAVVVVGTIGVGQRRDAFVLGVVAEKAAGSRACDFFGIRVVSILCCFTRRIVVEVVVELAVVRVVGVSGLSGSGGEAAGFRAEDFYRSRGVRVLCGFARKRGVAMPVGAGGSPGLVGRVGTVGSGMGRRVRRGVVVSRRVIWRVSVAFVIVAHVAHFVIVAQLRRVAGWGDGNAGMAGGQHRHRRRDRSTATIVICLSVCLGVSGQR